MHGCMTGNETWAWLARYSSWLLLDPIPEGNDPNTEIKRAVATKRVFIWIRVWKGIVRVTAEVVRPYDLMPPTKRHTLVCFVLDSRVNQTVTVAADKSKTSIQEGEK